MVFWRWLFCQLIFLFAALAEQVWKCESPAVLPLLLIHHFWSQIYKQRDGDHIPLLFLLKRTLIDNLLLIALLHWSLLIVFVVVNKLLVVDICRCFLVLLELSRTHVQLPEEERSEYMRKIEQ